jgi:two-component system NtrC family sensor kinase
VALPRKSAKNLAHNRKLRSTGTKSKARVGHAADPSAGLKKELDQRSPELAEALEQLVAAGDILRIIASSPKDAQPVFDSIAHSAARLCQARFCHVFQYDGELIHFAAHHGLAAEGIEAIRRAYPIPPGHTSAAARTILNGTIEQIPDVHADPDYKHGRLAQVVSYRSTVAVPMLKDGRPIGAISVARSESGYFPERQVELLRIFADQAVIAVENARLFDEVQAQKRELSKALEHQTATNEVLNVITRSPTDAQPVFDAIVQSAARLCEAMFSLVFLYDGDLLRPAATHNFTPEALHRLFQTYPKRPDRSLLAGRAVLDGRIAHVPDLLSDREYSHRLALAGNWRAGLSVPMLQDGKAVGAISVAKAEAVAFSERQIQLLTTFADQAVIAIQNVGLFDEVQARTRELSESLESQTATGEVLNVISRSPAQLQPVLDAIVNTAARMCAAEYSYIAKYEDNVLRYVAHVRVSDEHLKFLADPIRVDRGAVIGRVVFEKRTVHVPDVLADSEFDRLEWQKVGKQRTVLGVPLLREGTLIGVIILARTSVAPFTKKQIDLVTTFADQAVIAIENVRLFDEVQARTRDLSERWSSRPRPRRCCRSSRRRPGSWSPGLRDHARERGAPL